VTKTTKVTTQMSTCKDNPVLNWALQHSRVVNQRSKHGPLRWPQGTSCPDFRASDVIIPGQNQENDQSRFKCDQGARQRPSAVLCAGPHPERGGGGQHRPGNVMRRTGDQEPRAPRANQARLAPGRRLAGQGWELTSLTHELVQ